MCDFVITRPVGTAALRDAPVTPRTRGVGAVFIATPHLQQMPIMAVDEDVNTQDVVEELRGFLQDDLKV